MGRGIGQAFATGGYRVTLVDLNKEILNDAIAQINSSLSFMHGAGLLTESPEVIIGRISLDPDFDRAISQANLVVEAIFENLDAKKSIFQRMDAIARPDCILASNTTSLPITSIASLTTKPEKVIGSHFWNPPQLMQAVEVTRGENTSEESVEEMILTLRRIGKKPVLVRKDVPGQIVIRILYAMIREATWLVENGVATPEDIDTAVKEALGTRLEVVGPLELSDLSGVDLVNNVAKGLYRSLDSSQGPQKLIQDMVARGEVGIKTGKGFYNWKNGSKNVEDIIKLRDEHLIKILKERSHNN